MTRIVLFLWLLIFSSSTFGQLKKDDALLGVSGGYSQNKNSSRVSANANDSRTEMNIRGNARFGYFLKDRFALGLMGGYTKTVTKITTHSMTNLGELINNSTYTGKEYSIGVFSRFYKMIAEDRLAFFCQLDGSYITGTSEGKQKGSNGGIIIVNKEPDGEIKGMTVGLHPGFVYFIRRRIGIEVTFGTGAYDYRVRRAYIRGVKISENKSGGLNMNFGLTTFNLGVSFYLCEKK